MEQTPKQILEALVKSRAVSGFRLTNLKKVAKLLNDNCQLHETTIDTLAGKLLVSTRTAKEYVAVFGHAKAFLKGEHTSKAIEKAKAKVFPYLGVFALLSVPKPKKVVKTFREVGELELPKAGLSVQPVEERIPAKAAPQKTPSTIPAPEPTNITIGVLESKIKALTEELDVERSFTEELQQGKKDLEAQIKAVGEIVQRLHRLENMTHGICNLTHKTQKQLLQAAARYFENLVSILGIESSIGISRGLAAIARTLDETGLPINTIWQGRHWAKIVRTSDFDSDYLLLDPIRRKELLNALFLLSQNWRHPSLKSKKFEVNPPGVPPKAFHSSASYKLKFFWTNEFKADGTVIVTLHKLDWKRG